jgi:hypothetical protein
VWRGGNAVGEQYARMKIGLNGVDLWALCSVIRHAAGVGSGMWDYDYESIHNKDIEGRSCVRLTEPGHKQPDKRGHHA